MKKITTLLILAFAIISVSCKKETTESGSPAVTNKIQTKIDGTLWSNPVSNWASSGGTVSIYAFKSDGTSMSVFIPEDTTGTFDATDDVVTISYSNGSSTWSDNVSGTITVNENSATSVDGNFNIVLASYFNTDTFNLTEGKFNWTRN